MGAWRYIAMAMREIPFIGITRPPAAAAAEGSKQLHEKRLKALLDEIFSYAKVKV